MAPTCTLKPFAEDTAPFAGACFSALAIGPGVALLACAGAALPAGAGVAGAATLLGAVGSGDVFTGGEAFVGAAFDGTDGCGGPAFVSAFAAGCFATAAGGAGTSTVV